MGRRRGYYDEDEYDWGAFLPSAPIRVEGGIKAKSERGSIGSTWWSRRWVSVLESLGMGARLTRGRSYARQGQVLSIDVEPGLVKAKVQGSQPRPYSVTIRLKPLSDDDWEQVTQAMAAQALFAAKLLAGEMPTNIEEAFASVHISLFPTSARDLSTDCSCPDWANPCKHIAAVYYLLAERFDEDPFLIFKLRGRTKEQIIETLREKRAVSTPAVHEEPAPEADEAEPLLPLEADLETFWRAGEGLETFAVNPAAPTVERALLKRLGDAPFSVKGQNVASLLGRAYDVVESVVRERLAGEDTA